MRNATAALAAALVIAVTGGAPSAHAETTGLCGPWTGAVVPDGTFARVPSCDGPKVCPRDDMLFDYFTTGSCQPPRKVARPASRGKAPAAHPHRHHHHVGPKGRGV